MNQNAVKAFPILQNLNGSISGKNIKIHLASTNEVKENPLDFFVSGKFEEWQSLQTKKNFERKQVLSLISLPERNKWLFAGIYTVSGVKKNNDIFKYDLVEDESFSALKGRLVIHFERPGRQSYLNCERWSESLFLHEILEKKLSVSEFPGFNRVSISKNELDMIVENDMKTWKTALSQVSGVYLISDRKTEKLYVGKASGKENIWGRWCAYSKSGHAGNKELKTLIEKEGVDRSSDFTFSILEVANINSDENEIFQRECFWKNILFSRTKGLNKN